jgi:hypothetical protein
VVLNLLSELNSYFSLLGFKSANSNLLMQTILPIFLQDKFYICRKF